MLSVFASMVNSSYLGHLYDELLLLIHCFNTEKQISHGVITVILHASMVRVSPALHTAAKTNAKFQNNFKKISYAMHTLRSQQRSLICI